MLPTEEQLAGHSGKAGQLPAFNHHVNALAARSEHVRGLNRVSPMPRIFAWILARCPQIQQFSPEFAYDLLTESRLLRSARAASV